MPALHAIYATRSTRWTDCVVLTLSFPPEINYMVRVENSEDLEGGDYRVCLRCIVQYLQYLSV